MPKSKVALHAHNAIVFVSAFGGAFYLVAFQGRSLWLFGLAILISTLFCAVEQRN